MQLVLADISVVVGRGYMIDLLIEGRQVSECMSAYIRGHPNMTHEDRVKKHLVTEIMKTEADIGGSLWIKIRSDWEFEQHKITVKPSVPDKSILKSVVQKLQEKVKISLYFRWNDFGTLDFTSLGGIAIDPEMLTCVGNKTGSLPFLYNPPHKVSVKLMADINITNQRGPSGSFALEALKKSVHSALKNFAGNGGEINGLKAIKSAPFGKKILDEEAFSDIIITAGNGAEVKAHKLFLSACSPVLEVMLGSGMKESQTGRVDMSDLSEKSVRTFLRYVYYGDLQEPQMNTHVAYELFYAGHKYDVPVLEAEMRMLLVETKNEDIGVELAFKIFIFTRTIETAVKLKTKALEILRRNGTDKDRDADCLSSLESMIETFLGETNHESLDVAVAFKILMFTRNIDSAADLKTKALRVLRAKWDEMELLQEYIELFEKHSDSKAAMAMAIGYGRFNLKLLA